MWIINEYGDAADISKAVMLTVAEKETENKKFFAVKAKFGMVAEGNMRGEGYGEFYESEMTLKNFDSSAEAQNYITRLVKNLNGENFRNDVDKLGYSFTWLTKLKNASDDDDREQILKDWLAEILDKKSPAKSEKEND